MKMLLVNDDTLQAEKIIKTDTNIIGYIDNKEVFAFRGIKDFSIFKLENGEFDTLEEDLQQEINAKLLKDSANLQVELNKQRELNADLLLKIAELGGDVNA
ncbi:hypothetical protein DP124_01400 [Clostridium tetani]|uniref:hypothetical protein n=1 Tax=Clostridium tetani TaxID=1513 RepID=UPI00100B3AD7|nr:hypothetical protein [Clostridium tetani]RXI55553.1 hypothetical protein DP124_01400 [Clostridium tetani]RXM71999.1 hypothetical protein DP143_09335 [Clostridium tetani]